MAEKTQLREWYDGIDKSSIQPNGQIKINVPVLDADTGEHITKEDHPELPIDEPKPEVKVVIQKTEDPVIVKDKNHSFHSFIILKKMQGCVTNLAGLPNPYEDGSIERQETLDTLKLMYSDLGKEIALL